MNTIVIILSIYLHRLKNESHAQFNRIVNEVWTKYGIDQLGIAALHRLYVLALNNEMEALDFIRGSSITVKITDQDHKRDLAYRGFCDTLKGATHHFDLEHQEAANLILNHTKHYGNIARKSLDDETIALDKLLSELREPVYWAALSLLGLQSWIDKLQEENDLFSKLMTERYIETANKTSNRMREARIETDKYYHAIVNHVENQWLTGDRANEACIKEWNAVIERFKHILAQETAERKNSSDENENSSDENENEPDIINNS
jgi:hypothetical protein